MATAARKKLTYADFAKLPTDGSRHEVIDGEEFQSSLLPGLSVDVSDVFGAVP